MKSSLWNRVLWLAIIAPFCCHAQQVTLIVNGACGTQFFYILHGIGSPSANVIVQPGCTGNLISGGGGTTTSFGFCASYPPSDHIWVSNNGATAVDSGQLVSGGCTIIVGAGGVCSSVTYSNGPPNSYSGCITVTNNATAPVTPIGAAYPSQPCPGGSSIPTGTPINTTTMPTLAPGQSEQYCFTNGSPFTQVVLMPVLDLGGFSDNYDVVCQQAGTNSNNNAGGGGNGVPSTGGTNGVANAPGSGWGNNTNLTGQQYASGVSNTIAAIVGEGTALGNALNGNLGSIGSTLRTISGQLGPTNGGSGGSNVFVVGSVYSTNAAVYTNLSSGTNQTLSMGLTNMWGGSSNMLSVLTNALGAPPSLPSGSPSALSFTFCGYTLNLDPENVFPGYPSVIRTIIGWGAAIWFGMWFGAKLWELTQTYAQAQTGGVPDLDAELLGFGGNVAGVAVAIIVPVVFVIIWVAVFTIVIGWGLSVVGGSNWTANPFSTMNSASPAGSAALYLLQDLLPLAFLLSLIWARLGCEFGLSLLVAAGATASRYLFGR